MLKMKVFVARRPDAVTITPRKGLEHHRVVHGAAHAAVVWSWRWSWCGSEKVVGWSWGGRGVVVEVVV